MSNTIGGSGSSGASAAASAPSPTPSPSPTSSSPSSSCSPAQSANNFQDGIQYANNGSPDDSSDDGVNGATSSPSASSTPSTAGTPSSSNTPGSGTPGSGSASSPQHFQDEVNHIMASLEQALESHHMFTGGSSGSHANSGQGGGGNNINYGPHSQGNNSHCGPQSQGNNINYGPQSHGNNSGCGSNSGYNPGSSSNGGTSCPNGGSSVPGTSSAPGGNAPGNALTSIPGQHGPSTGSPNTYNTNASAGKQQIISALDRAGATPQEKAEILAMGAQETNDFQSNERDKKKDGTSSANYSAFNLNGYELRKFGYQGNLNALNNQSNIGTAATTLLHGIRQNGLANVQDLTRGGQSGENQVNNPQYEQWRNGQNASAEKYLQGNHFTDNTRIAAPASYW